MIAYVKGILIAKQINSAIIECNGLGYNLLISKNTFNSLPELSTVCKLHTYLSIREDAHVLFGFYALDEKGLFELLITVSGVGPSTGMNILSSTSTSELATAISTGNINLIKSMKGIGPKTAQRIVLELKDKILKTGLASIDSTLPVNSVRKEALAALSILGFQKLSAEKAVDLVLSSEENLSVEEVIKRALKSNK